MTKFQVGEWVETHMYGRGMVVAVPYQHGPEYKQNYPGMYVVRRIFIDDFEEIFIHPSDIHSYTPSTDFLHEWMITVMKS